MKRKKIYLIFIIIAIVILILCWKNELFYKKDDSIQQANTYVTEILNTYDLPLLDNYNITYYQTSDFSFRGDGLKYFVIKLKKSIQISEFELNDIKNEEFESQLNEAIHIEKKDFLYTPPFSKQYCWRKIDKYNDSLYIAFFLESLELYIIESRI